MAELYRMIKAVFIGMIFLISVPVFLFAQSKTEQEIFNCNIPLLLNSGFTDNNKAWVKYILWTQDSSNLEELELHLINSGFSWKREILKDFSGSKRSYKYIAQAEVSMDEERLNLEKLNVLAKQLKTHKIQLYVHEQIKGNVDIEGYLQYIKLRDIRRTKSSGLISNTGYADAINQGIQAGSRKINIQLISKENSTSRETVLAIPALLEEF